MLDGLLAPLGGDFVPPIAMNATLDWNGANVHPIAAKASIMTGASAVHFDMSQDAHFDNCAANSPSGCTFTTRQKTTPVNIDWLTPYVLNAHSVTRGTQMSITGTADLFGAGASFDWRNDFSMPIAMSLDIMPFGSARSQAPLHMSTRVSAGSSSSQPLSSMARRST